MSADWNAAEDRERYRALLSTVVAATRGVRTSVALVVLSEAIAIEIATDIAREDVESRERLLAEVIAGVRRWWTVVEPVLEAEES